MSQLPPGFVLDGQAPATGPQFPSAIRGNPRPPAQPTPKNPYDIETDRRDYEDKQGEQLFSNEQALRKEFDSLPAVKEFQVAARTYANSLQAGDDASGDQSLIVAYAKMLDPSSVVREGEANAVAGADSTIGRTIARLNKEFGFESGGQLSPDIRRKIRREMKTLADNYGKAYELERGQYESLAQNYGFEPSRIVRAHLMDPYRETVDSYWAAQEQAVARNPTQAQVYADGIKFGMDGGDDAPFDRGAYLSERYGLQPGQEAEISAFWNANRGNTALTVDAVKQWYQGKGIPLPSDQDIQTGVEAAQKGVAFGSFDTKKAEQEYVGQLDAALEQRGADPESVGGSIGIGAAQGITWRGLDELAGVSGAIGGALRGQNPIDAYGAERDIVRREFQRAEEAHPYITGASEIGGAIVTGGAGFRSSMRAARLAGQARQAGNAERASRLGRQAVTSSIAPGAAGGAAYGFNAGEGAQNSLVQGALGGLGGAIVAPVTQMGVNALAPRMANMIPARAGPTAEQRNALAAGERMGVPMRQADIRPEVRNERSVLRTSPNGQPIRDAEVADVEAIENAVGRELVGNRNPARREVMGENAQEALGNVRTRTGQQIGQMYDRARELAGNQPYRPNNAIAELDRQIAEVSASGEAANRGLLSYLRDIRNDLTQGGPVNTGLLDARGNPITRDPAGLTIDALRNQRTNMRGQINERNLTRTDAERRVGLVLDAASRDIADSLGGNPAALRIFNEADRAWAERHRFVKQVMEKVVGPENQPKSGGAAASTIEGWVKGDFRRFRDMWARLEPTERNEIAATIADNLGRDARGEFSLAAFLKHTGGGRGASLSDRSARLIFGDDGMRAIADLRAIAQAKVDAGSQTNFSNTGNIVQKAGRGLRGLLFAGLGMSAGGPVAGAGAAVASSIFSGMGERRAVRMLLNPDFTRWLRQAPNTNEPRVIDRYFERLDSIAARTPGMAADVEALKQGLLGAVNDNAAVTTRAAAEDQQGQ